MHYFTARLFTEVMNDTNYEVAVMVIIVVVVAVMLLVVLVLAAAAHASMGRHGV